MTASSYSRSRVEQICNKAQLLMLPDCHFNFQQVSLSTPVTKTYERTEINAVNERNDVSHEQFSLLYFISWLVLDPLGGRAARLSLQPVFEHPLPDKCTRTPIIPLENSPTQTPSSEEYPIPLSGLGLQRRCPAFPTRPQTYPGILNVTVYTRQ